MRRTLPPISVLIFLISALARPAHAVIPLAWTRVHDSGGEDAAKGVAGDGAGGVVTAAETPGGVRIARYAADGTLLWSATEPAVASSVGPAVNPVTGDVFVAAGTSADPSDLVLVKYSPSGARRWSATFDGGGSENPVCLGLDGAGQVTLAGNSNNGVDFDIYVVKVRGDSGARLWDRLFAGTGADGATDDRLVSAGSIASTPAGDVIVVALVYEASTGDDVMVMKYAAADGALLGQYRYDAGGDEKAWSAAIDGGGNVFATGRSRASGGEYGFLTLKFSPAIGPPAASATQSFPGGSKALFIALEGSDNVYVAGESHNGTDTDVTIIRYAASDLTIRGGPASYDSGGNETPRGLTQAGSGDFILLAGRDSGSLVLLSDNGASLSEEFAYSAPGAIGEGVAASGSLVFTGASQSNGTNQDIVLLAAGTTPQAASGGGGGGCFVATAAFGSPLATEVEALRKVRDAYLLPSPAGRRLVSFYNDYGPLAANIIARNPALRWIARAFLVSAVLLAGFILADPGVKMLTVVATLLPAAVFWLRKESPRGGDSGCNISGVI